MKPFDNALRAELADIEGAGLRRELRRIEGARQDRLQTSNDSCLNFSSNDYLGLATHPKLIEASRHALDRFGAGSTASRLVCGSLAIHHELEEALAAFKGTAAALTFSTGYSAALGALGAVLGRGDIVILDKRVHACCVDAARLCGATLRVFRHNDLDDLEEILRWARQRPAATGARLRRILVVTESVFSMDGDLAPLHELVELKDRHGAWLMLDEAHATGVFGERGAGLARERDVAHRIEIQLGTLGKALGAAGGFIAGSRPLVHLLINRARSFIFSTAPAPAAAGAALAGLQLAQSEEGAQRRETLWQRAHELAGMFHPPQQTPTDGSSRHEEAKARCAGPEKPPHVGHYNWGEVSGPATSPAPVATSAVSASSPIVPWMLGDEAAAVRAADGLRQSGIFAPAIRFPTVARGQARIRFTASAAHTAADLEQLGAALHSVWRAAT